MKRDENVRQWLDDHGFGQYAGLFEDNEIDSQVLPQLTNEDLRELGIPLGVRKKMLAALAAIEEVEASPAADRPTTTSEPPPAGDAERRQLTVMFCDLVGSTALSASYDPEELAGIVRSFQEECVKVVRRYDGFVARYMGDGMLVYFGYPQAHEDDAERALHVGLEILQRVPRLSLPEGLLLKTRIGVATGLVVVGETVGEGSSREQVVMGETPNLAARLQGEALPDQLLIADSTRKLCGTSFDIEALGARELKGFDGRVEVYAVRGERILESRFSARRDSNLPPIVGREQEVALLAERWRLACVAEGQLVLLCGEAGIGKSRIVQALRDHIAETEHYRISYQCSPYHRDSALFPVIQQLSLAAGFDRDDDDDARIQKLDDLLKKFGTNEQDRALLATMLGLQVEGSYGPLPYSNEQIRSLTLQACTDQLLGLAADKPVLFVLEDAHWIDPTTLELIELTLDAVSTARVLMLVTARPSFDENFGNHPLVTRLTLNRLGHEQVRSIVTRVSQGKTLPGELVDTLAARTDGIPLFVEELTKAVLESGALEETDSSYEFSGSLTNVPLPSSLQDSLMARLDQMNTAKEIAQTAACIGREFSRSLLQSVVDLETEELEVALARLVKAELIHRRGRQAENTYQFKHALVRDAAYESLLKSKRQRIHANLVRVLEEARGSTPELLAQHAEAAGLLETAADYWLQAGTHATERSALKEAVHHYRSGLEVVKRLPPSDETDKLEIEFQNRLATALNGSEGWASKESIAANDRARALCEKIGDIESLLHVLRQQRIIAWINGEYRAADQIAKQMIDLVGDERLPADARVYRRGDLGIGEYLRLFPRLALGELEAVRRGSSAVVNWYDPPHHRDYRFYYGIDLLVAALALKGYGYLLSGQLEQASTDNAKSIAYARELEHEGSLCWSLTWAGSQPASMSRDVETALALTAELLGRQYSRMDLAWAQIFQGWARAVNGEQETGIVEMRMGLDYLGEIGAVVFRSLHLSLLAELYLDSGKDSLARQTLTEADDHIARTGERFWEAEIHRLWGRLVEAEGAASDVVVEHYERARRVATEVGTSLLELRACTSLAQHLADNGQGGNARQLLAPEYEQFDEGFDFPDLVAARTLLSNL